MLKPACLYKDEIQRKSQEMFYTEDYALYQGYPEWNRINVEDNPGTNLYQFASMDSDEKLIGFISFNYNSHHSCADKFGIVSFDKGNPIFIRDLYKCLDMIINQFKCHRMEWWVVDTNPVKRHYDKFCKKHDGTIHRFRDVFKDQTGKYHDSYTYEIIFQHVEDLLN